MLLISTDSGILLTSYCLCPLQFDDVVKVWRDLHPRFVARYAQGGGALDSAVLIPTIV
jgi:hypothetical protein